MANNWKNELSSGHMGFRCSKCGTWKMFHSPLICDCPIPVADSTILEQREKINVLKDELKDVQIDLKTAKQLLKTYLRMNRK